MEIAPIPGIRAIAPTNVRRVDGPMPRFEVEASARTDDETYSPSQQAPDRGLEEEDSGTDDETENGASDSVVPGSGTTINFIA